MTLPTIHLNGTSKEALMTALTDASFALDAAYEVAKLSAPNGRDYYPQGPAALDAATKEHMARLNAIDAVKKQFDELASAIDSRSSS